MVDLQRVQPKLPLLGALPNLKLRGREDCGCAKHAAQRVQFNVGDGGDGDPDEENGERGLNAKGELLAVVQRLDGHHAGDGEQLGHLIEPNRVAAEAEVHEHDGRDPERCDERVLARRHALALEDVGRCERPQGEVREEKVARGEREHVVELVHPHNGLVRHNEAHARGDARRDNESNVHA